MPRAVVPGPNAGPVRRTQAKPDETRRRLLDAAEALFAELGFAGTSMRAVTQAAGTSVSAANYHFGSKEELLRETLMRRVQPVNERRLRELDRLEARGADAPPSVTELVEALVRPALEFQPEGGGGREVLRHVAARLYADPPELVSSIKQSLFGTVTRRFLAAFERALPELGGETVALRFQLLIGSMAHVLAGQLDAPNHPRASAPDREFVCEELVRFGAAALDAGSPTPSASRTALVERNDG